MALSSVGAFLGIIDRSWTLTLINNSVHTLEPLGTDESSGYLETPLRDVDPGDTAIFIWKKTKMAAKGAVGAIYFRVGETGKVVSIFGCIPRDFMYYSALCNLHLGSQKVSADNLEDGKGPCKQPTKAGEVGRLHGSEIMITNAGHAQFTVKFNLP